MAALIAEAGFMAMMAGVALARGGDPWLVTKMPAVLVIGPDAVQPAGFVAGDVAVGVALHAGLAVLVGVIYAALLPRVGIGAIAGGLITGGVIYALGFWMLPRLFPAWLGPFWLPAAERAIEAVTHAIYGVVLGLVYRTLVHRAGSTSVTD